MQFLDSIVVSIPACHAGDRGSIPRRGGTLFIFSCPSPFVPKVKAACMVTGHETKTVISRKYFYLSTINLFCCL